MFLCGHCHKASVFQSEGKPIAVVSTLGYAAIRAFSVCGFLYSRAKMSAMPHDDRHCREHPCKYIQKAQPPASCGCSQRTGGIMEYYMFSLWGLFFPQWFFLPVLWKAHSLCNRLGLVAEQSYDFFLEVAVRTNALFQICQIAKLGVKFHRS